MDHPQITQELLRELVAYDPLSGVVTWLPRQRGQFKTLRGFKTWNAKYAGRRAGTTDGRHGCRMIVLFDKSHLEHRLIWLLVFGRLPDQIDHINGNPSDNRLVNLRDVTDQENKRNLPMFCTNKSGAVGVFWRANRQCWQAQITLNNRPKYLGNYRTKEEAIARRKEAEQQYGFHVNHGRAA